MNLQYIEDVLRTESPRFDIEGMDAEAMVETLKAFAHLAQAVDAIKRGLFYGKGFDRDKLINRLYEAKEAINGALASNGGPVTHKGKQVTANQVPVRVLHSTLGLATETGEIMEKIVESLEEDTPFDWQNYYEELGDLMWYKALGIASGKENDKQMYWSHVAICDSNVAKLAARYPEKFSSCAAYNRDLDKEKEAMKSAAT